METGDRVPTSSRTESGAHSSSRVLAVDKTLLVIDALERSRDIVFISKVVSASTSTPLHYFEHVYVSPSVSSVLGHDVAALYRPIASLTQLFPENFITQQLPVVTIAFLESVASGQPFHQRVQNQLLHASGTPLDFDTEITQHPTL